MRRAWRTIGVSGPVLLAAACSDFAPEIVLVIETPVSTDVTVGDFLTLALTASGSAAGVTWSSSDEGVAVVQDGTVEARRPGQVRIAAAAPNAVTAEVVLTVVERPGGYTAEEIDYFTEIAFGAEFGTSSPLLRRWRLDAGPRIRINGSPSPGDLLVLDSVIVEIVGDYASVEMHFVPEASFRGILPQAPPGNIGIAWVWWDPADDYLFESVVLISTDESEPRRAHVIREEITQMLGLLQDSFLYPRSVFYQGPSFVGEYLPIDRAVIEILYRPELTVGTPLLESAQVARTLLRAGAHAPLVARADGAASVAPPAPAAASRAPEGWWGGLARGEGPGIPGSAGGSTAGR